MVKNVVLTFFSALRCKARFAACYIFNDLQSLKMSAHPCAAHRVSKNFVFPHPADTQRRGDAIAAPPRVKRCYWRMPSTVRAKLMLAAAGPRS